MTRGSGRRSVLGMPTDPGPDRRVTRLENDVESIYDLLTDLRTVQDSHTARLDRMEGQLTRHDGRLGRIESQLTDHDGRFDRIDDTLAEVLRRLPET